jgi:hypothetical protein
MMPRRITRASQCARALSRTTLRRTKMRKITKDAAWALKRGIAFKRANTEVVDHGTYRAMYLHGNLIALRDGHVLKLKMAGWGSVTTRERLNGILDVFGLSARIYQEKFEQHLYWCDGPGCGHYPIDTQKWLNFTVIDPARTHALQEWNPFRYWGQVNEEPEAMREYVATYLKARDLEED